VITHDGLGLGRVRVAVLASGAGSTFEALLDAGVAGVLDPEICLLIASRASCGALGIAARCGVAHETFDESVLGHEAVDEMMLAAILVRQIDLIILGGYTRKIGPRTLAAYPRQILNTHPAPLPRFGGKGMYGERVHEAVLQSGVEESAATVHLIDAEYDTGPVIAVQSVPIMPGDDVAALRDRVQIAERGLLLQTLNGWRVSTVL
jgi:phosphoribosylglycinamide formyltransferase-1